LMYVSMQANSHQVVRIIYNNLQNQGQPLKIQYQNKQFRASLAQSKHVKAS
jgi:flavodoxin